MPFSIQAENGITMFLSAPVTSTREELLLCALFTVAIEVPIFYYLGYREYKILMGFVVANLVSNLLMNEYLTEVYTNEYWLLLTMCEFTVVVFEYCFMRYFITNNGGKLLKSLIITNFISCMMGVVWFLLEG